jgi:isoleucyl-tRNA synthetase
VKYNEYKNLDYAKVGEDILAYWKANRIFEKSVETREGHAPFVFYEGPPSANGTPGIHHVMARAVKDIFCRYKTLKGYQVNRKGGLGYPRPAYRAAGRKGTRHYERRYR